MTVDQLLSIPRNGRTGRRLAEGWSASADGLTLRLRLRPSVTFDDGKPVNAQAVRAVLQAGLPDAMGSAFDDIAEIRATSELEVEFTLRQRSTFLLEALGSVSIADPTSKESGAGPFSVQAQHNGEVEMRANARYYGGKPPIDRVILKPYASVRSAWADMLRGRVDMLYEVGVDALDSLESSNEVNIFTFQRTYAYLLLLNVRTPTLRDPAFRRRLNAAIERQSLDRRRPQRARRAGGGAHLAAPLGLHRRSAAVPVPAALAARQPIASSPDGPVQRSVLRAPGHRDSATAAGRRHRDRCWSP